MASIYALMADGVVVNLVEWEGNDTETGWEPPAGQEAIAVPEGAPVSIGWTHTADGFVAPPPTAEDKAAQEAALLMQRETIRTAQVNQAVSDIIALQFTVDNGDATDEEKARLTALKQYLVDIKALDLTTDVNWPEYPA